MQSIRLIKCAMVAAVALLFTLFAIGNVTDYDSNWQFVQHVMSMDTIFADSTLRWRAITSAGLQTVVYWMIIAWQIVTAIVLWVGLVRLLRALSSAAFDQSKPVAVVGLGLGFLLYTVIFLAGGGEWFAMWQSSTWNGQQSAFNYLTVFSAVLIVLLIRDEPAGATER